MLASLTNTSNRPLCLCVRPTYVAETGEQNYAADASTKTMTRTDFSRTVEIQQPPPIVWSVMTDIERWPEWTPSVARAKRLSNTPLQVGSRAQIHQPKL